MNNLLRGIKIKKEIMKDKNIPIPPNNAVGCLCHRSSFASAIKPYRCENLIMRGVTAIERIKERRKGNRYCMVIK
jgi:hypothetical protein